MRYLIFTFVMIVAVVLAVLGLRGGISRKPPVELFSDMVRQPRQRPQFQSPFFSDARGSRSNQTGVVAFGLRNGDSSRLSGRLSGTTNFVEVNPLPITSEFLINGQGQYNLRCLPCHGALADGNGITKKIGAMGIIASLHDKRIVTMTDGELFSTVTHGKNLMGAYGAEIGPDDRWAIIAYLRALQLTRLGIADDMPESIRSSYK